MIKPKRKRMTRKETQEKKEVFLELLENNLGIKSPILKKLELSTATLDYWIKNDEEFNKRYLDIREMAIDFVESKLYENIKNNDKASIIFYLKCQAKHRGYVEREEHVHEFKPIETIYIKEKK